MLDCGLAQSTAEALRAQPRSYRYARNTVHRSRARRCSVNTRDVAPCVALHVCRWCGATMGSPYPTCEFDSPRACHTLRTHGYVRYVGIREIFATFLQVMSIFHKLLYSKTSDILVGNSLQNAAPIPYTELPARLLVLLVESFHCLGSETLLSCSPASRVVRSVLVVTL